LVIVIENGARAVAYDVPSDNVKYDPAFRQVTLTTPRGGSSTFSVKSVERRDDETVYVLREHIADDDSGPYPEPLPPDEIDRLESGIRAAGATPTVWAQGEGYLEHINRLWKQLRDLRDSR
jgi:hypothetical protein